MKAVWRELEEVIKASRGGHVPDAGSQCFCATPTPVEALRPSSARAAAPRSLLAALAVSLTAHAALAALVWTSASPDPQPGIVELIVVYAGDEMTAPAGQAVVILDAPAPLETLAAELSPPAQAPAPQAAESAVPVQAQMAALASEHAEAFEPLKPPVQPAQALSSAPPVPQSRANTNREPRAQKTRTDGRSAAASRGAQTTALAPPHDLTAVLARLQQAKRFPEKARARGDEGRAGVRLSIQRSGALGHAQVVRSSGSALLDQAALDTVRRAAPFPPLPAEIAGAALVLNAPMNFTQESPY